MPKFALTNAIQSIAFFWRHPLSKPVPPPSVRWIIGRTLQAGQTLDRIGKIKEIP